MSDRILNVPYKSQNDVDATLKRDDSGPACLAMLLAALGQEISTNAVAATGDIAADGTLSLEQVITVGHAFGLELSYRTGCTLEDLKQLIDKGQPGIALIKYDKIIYRWNKTSTERHFVMVVGYDNETNRVIVNDPDYPPGPQGYQVQYSYKVFLNAWGGFNSANQPNYCLVIPRLNKALAGVTITPLTAKSPLVISDDAWVVSPKDIALRAQADSSADEIGRLVYGQHIITLGLESAPDQAGCTWQIVHTDSGATGLVCASANGEQFIAKKQPPTPYLVTVMNCDPVRDARGLSVRPKRDIALPPIDRCQAGEQLVAYTRIVEVDGTAWLSTHSSRARFGWIREQSGSTTLVKSLEPVTSTPPAPQPPAEPWPFGKCLSGIGMGNPQPLTPAQLAIVAKSKVEAFKMLTLPNPDDNLSLIQSLKNISTIKFIIARLFFSVDVASKSRFSPEVFVGTVFDGAHAAYQAGVRFFEVHNEPNLESEGMGWNWSNGAEFSSWLTQVMTLMRQRLPEIRLGFPGLSPQPNVSAFLDGASPAIAYCDWVGAHCYWQSASQGPFPMTSTEAGMYWRRFRQRFPGKLLMLTEFSNNQAGVDPVEKGRQYARYYQLLRSEVNLGAAFSFALSWPGRDVNRESWEADNRETAIPGVVGELLGQPGFLA